MNTTKNIRNFELWSDEKIKLECETNELIVHPGQFWTYKVGINLGGEISKDADFVRPCMILNNDIGFDLIIIVPISSSYEDKDKDKEGYYIEIENWADYGFTRKSFFAINQIKTISAKRLGHEISGKNRFTLTKYKRYGLDDLEILQKNIFSKTIGYSKTKAKQKRESIKKQESNN